MAEAAYGPLVALTAWQALVERANLQPRQKGLRPPLELVMALLSFKTRRAARRQGVRYSFLFMHASGAQLGEIAKLIDTGVLRPIIDRTYPFDEAAKALAHVEGGRAKGK